MLYGGNCMGRPVEEGRLALGTMLLLDKKVRVW